MNVKYKMKNGETISCFLWDDMLDSNPNFIRTNAEIKVNNKTKKITVLFDEKEEKKYFEYKGEKKYFDDYEYLPYAELVKRLKEDSSKDWLRSDDVITTFLNEPEKIAIISDISVSEIRMPGMGMSISSDNTIKTILIPTEYRYKKEQWYYKISFYPLYDGMRSICSARTYYFSDFTQLIRDNHIQLINLDDYKEDIETQTQKYLSQINKEKNNIFIRFIANIKRKKEKYNFEEKIISVPIMKAQGNLYSISKDTKVLLKKDDIFFPVSLN